MSNFRNSAAFLIWILLCVDCDVACEMMCWWGILFFMMKWNTLVFLETWRLCSLTFVYFYLNEKQRLANICCEHFFLWNYHLDDNIYIIDGTENKGDEKKWCRLLNRKTKKLQFDVIRIYNMIIDEKKVTINSYGCVEFQYCVVHSTSHGNFIWKRNLCK